MVESGAVHFAATHWSMVRRAVGSHDDAAAKALGSLCEAYWPPVYAYLRCHGHAPHEAEDLTQEFFAEMLARRSLARADERRGRFRSFLLACLNRFLGHERRRSQALKRGGAVGCVPLVVEEAERRLSLEAAADAPPERVYDRQWAQTLLDRTATLLREEFVRAGRADRFEALSQCLCLGDAPGAYASLAARLNMTEGAVKVAVHRLRNRYREILRAQVAQTVDGDGEIDGEVRYLLSVVSG